MQKHAHKHSRKHEAPVTLQYAHKYSQKHEAPATQNESTRKREQTEETRKVNKKRGPRRAENAILGDLGGLLGALGEALEISLVSPYSPSGLVTTPPLPPSTLLCGPFRKTCLIFTSFFFSFFVPSWLAFGPHFGAFWVPKLAQVRHQVAS